jgi:hypothetical protein
VRSFIAYSEKETARGLTFKFRLGIKKADWKKNPIGFNTI